MIKRGTSTLYLEFQHPEVDIEDKACIEVKWIYIPEIPPSPYNDFGEPYDFSFEVEVISKADWITLDMIDEALTEVSIQEIMNH